MLCGRRLGVVAALGLPCLSPELEAGDATATETGLDFVMVPKSTSKPSAFLITTFDRAPGTNVFELAFNRALTGIEDVDGVGGGDVMPLRLLEVEWECGGGGWGTCMAGTA
jgi:hypothetical protein